MTVMHHESGALLAVEYSSSIVDLYMSRETENQDVFYSIDYSNTLQSNLSRRCQSYLAYFC